MIDKTNDVMHTVFMGAQMHAQVSKLNCRCKRNYKCNSKCELDQASAYVTKAHM
jgi:hypothetical protein